MTRLTEQQTWTDTDTSRQLKSRAEACVEIATKAADVARTTRTTEVEWKAPGDAVTLADKASGTFIFDEVRKRFPSDSIITEETPPHAGSSEFLWLADPLDGTLNAMRNMAPWVVSVAVLRGRNVVAACIVEGTSGDVFTAARGGGAKRNGQPIHVSTTAALKHALLGFDCPYDPDARMTTTYGAVGELLAPAAALRCYGSCAFALCKIAAGELDAYAVEFGKSWDFAAGVLLVREAGGTVTTWADHHYYPEHDTQVLATNGLLHDTVVDLLKPYRRA